MSKQPITLEMVSNSLSDATNQLQYYFKTMNIADVDSIKLMNEYMKWIQRKTELVAQEKFFKLPFSAIPNKISNFTYNWLNPEKQLIIQKYYKLNSAQTEYVISIKKSDIADTDLAEIINTLILKRGNVVWIEFGYNIGCEFGGKHPALILKNNKTSLFVVPISSQRPNNPSSQIHVEIPKIYGFTEKTRWINVFHKQNISVLRVDFNSPIGNIKKTILTNISQCIATNIVK